jgi:hypothetical protein
MPTARSLFLLAVLTLFAGFAMTVAGWQGRVAVSVVGSIGVLWFHFRATMGAERGKRPAWTRHILLLSFIIANLLRGLGSGGATVFFLLMVAALMADVYVTGAELMSRTESVEAKKETKD